MGFAFNGTSSTVAVTGNVSIGRPAGSTQIIASGAATGAATTTIHTVTAGKTLYITGFTVLAGNTVGGTSACSLEVDVGGTFYKLMLHSPPAAGQGNQTFCVGLMIPIEVAATKTVRVVSDAVGGAIEASIFGYEV